MSPSDPVDQFLELLRAIDDREEPNLLSEVGPESETSVSPMVSAQHCRDQAAECIRMMKLAKSSAEAEVLRNISSSWSRLAGQIDRYAALVRERGRIARD